MVSEGVYPRERYYLTDGAGRHYAVAESDGTIHPDVWGESITQYIGFRATGAVTKSHSYGEERLGTASAPGLSFFRNRVYDQETGRWTQEDPIVIAGGINLYQFNGNDPANFDDPYGLCPPIESCVIGYVQWEIGGHIRAQREAADTRGAIVPTGHEAFLVAPIQGAFKAVAGRLTAKGASGIGGAIQGLRAGSSSRVKLVDSEDALEGLFGRLSAGGKPVQGSAYPGRLVELPDGTKVGIRATSTSGGPTIDIHPPSGPRLKVHVGGAP